MDLNNQNFFEWGIESQELQTDSDQVKGVSPITKVSFSRAMVRYHPNSQMSGSTNIVAGTGEYSFQMAQSNTKMMDAFNLQTRLSKISFIRYSNSNGKLSEEEKYTAENAVITQYSFESSSTDGDAQIYKIKIAARGQETYRMLIRDENGDPSGYQVVSSGSFASS